ncbi:MAG TPA: KpsF/GutQ family sugar-phosphate isomerase [bacterium]|nr:KpsF/GutQ family sugar-phosphate isomerase [bacterium]
MGDALSSARRTLELEAAAVRALIPRLNVSFTRAVDLIVACRGRVVVSGMGKSGAIARKLAATLASTGTPALFLHPAEGSHGDLGMVTRGDVVIALSTSGETEELKLLLPALHRLQTPVIALCGRADSTLARDSSVMIDIAVSDEACPLGLAPTTSTTAALAMADALAMAVLARRNFTREDFAALHPGGMLGRQLLLRVSDLMHAGDELPRVGPDDDFTRVLCEMTGKRLGCTVVIDGAGLLAGIITDGDLRRILERIGDVRGLTARQMMTAGPRTVDPTALAAAALAKMSEHQITSLLVTDQGRPVGILHIHDVLRAGIR